MLYRTILKDLDLWAAKPNRKPLVLRGARQVGKTYAVKEFAKKFDTSISKSLQTVQYLTISFPLMIPYSNFLLCTA